jgi:hypothetical protein
MWIFRGEVADEGSLQDLVVVFGGIISDTATTDPNGDFSLVKSIPEGTWGMVTVYVIDDEGNQSDIYEYQVE